MTLPEAITYALVRCNGGSRTEQIAPLVNSYHSPVRKHGQPVTSAQVYATIMRYPAQFCKAEGRIMLMI